MIDYIFSAEFLTFSAKVAASLIFFGLLWLLAFLLFCYLSHFGEFKRMPAKKVADPERDAWFDEQDRECAADELAMAGKPITEANIAGWIKDRDGAASSSSPSSQRP